jgi:hypothetical protein
VRSFHHFYHHLKKGAFLLPFKRSNSHEELLLSLSKASHHLGLVKSSTAVSSRFGNTSGLRFVLYYELPPIASLQCTYQSVSITCFYLLPSSRFIMLEQRPQDCSTWLNTPSPINTSIFSHHHPTMEKAKTHTSLSRAEAQEKYYNSSLPLPIFELMLIAEYFSNTLLTEQHNRTCDLGQTINETTLSNRLTQALTTFAQEHDEDLTELTYHFNLQRAYNLAFWAQGGSSPASDSALHAAQTAWEVLKSQLSPEEVPQDPETAMKHAMNPPEIPVEQPKSTTQLLPCSTNQLSYVPQSRLPRTQEAPSPRETPAYDQDTDEDVLLLQQSQIIKQNTTPFSLPNQQASPATVHAPGFLFGASPLASVGGQRSTLASQPRSSPMPLRAPSVSSV